MRVTSSVVPWAFVIGAALASLVAILALERCLPSDTRTSPEIARDLCAGELTAEAREACEAPLRHLSREELRLRETWKLWREGP